MRLKVVVGLPTKAIAVLMGLSESTVERTLAAVRSRCGAHTTTQAAGHLDVKELRHSQEND